MNILHDRRLSRRTLLRGLGVTVALPWLEAMLPAAAPAKERPVQTIFMYCPNGMYMKSWALEDEGPLDKLSAILEPLDGCKSDFNVLSGLDNTVIGPQNNAPHARAAAGFLSCAAPVPTRGVGNAVRSTVSTSPAVTWPPPFATMTR